MAASNDLLLINTTNGKRINLRAVSLIKPKKTQIPVTTPLVNTTPDATIIFRFTGQAKDLLISFALFDDGVDVSGLSALSKVTVAQQRAYLEDDIFTHEFGTSWTLTDNTGIFLTTQITGVISSLEFDGKQGAQTVLTGTIVFQQGRIGSV